MISIGFDPSLRSFGWAVIDTSEKGMKRRVESGHCATTSSECQPARYIHLQNLVKSILNKHPEADVIGVESPAYSGGPFQSIHHSLMMFSLAEIFVARKNCVLFDPSTREYLVRNNKKGRISKLDVQRFVQIDTLDPVIIQNDEADAYVIGLFAARFMELKQGIITPDELSPAEMHKFISMTKKVKTLKGVKIKHVGHVFRENNRYYEFEKVPPGSVSLPDKTVIRPEILTFLEDLEDETNTKTKTKRV
jgi:Holliday junction resolvasome RuvABC endonuclease subunit